MIQSLPFENEVRTAFAVVAATGRLALRALSNAERLAIALSRDAVAVGRDAEALYVSAQASAGDLGAAARATPRMLRILREAACIAASYRLQAAYAEVMGAPGAARVQARLEALHETNAKRVYALCVELRGPILKLAQLLSGRPDLLPPIWIETLAGLQDRVPPAPLEAIVARVEAELGGPLDQHFRSFEPEPLGTASLAQVHGAELLDGRRVAVKVALPDIEALFDGDLRALRALGSVLSVENAGALALGDVQTTLDELARSIREELDFAQEADNARAFAALQHAGVRVPAVVDALSTRHVLTLERLDGPRLREVLDAQPERRDPLLHTLVASFCQQIFVDGLVHADPHPGNLHVLATDPDQLVLLDFGAVLRLDAAQRQGLARLGVAVLQDDEAAMVAAFDALGYRTASGDSASLVSAGRALMAPFREGARMDDFNPAEQLTALLGALQQDAVVKVPAEMVLLGRVLATLTGMLGHYRPNVDLGMLLLPAITSALLAS